MNVALHARHAGGPDILSVCAGGGGLDLGVRLAFPGARTVCYVEREAFACAHLVASMRAGVLDDAPVWSDAKTFDGRAWRGCLDGVVGGIPCQPHSVAGRKRGKLDERDLWSAFRKIVVASGAWFVVVENVPGMLAAGADEIAGAERVWRDLRRLGFAVEGGLFSAEEVGAPHERARLFVLGVHDGLADAHGGRRRAQGDGREPSSGPDRCCGELGDAALFGWREGRAEHGVRGGRDTAAGHGRALVDAKDVLCDGGHDHSGKRIRGKVSKSGNDGREIFPPRPGDVDGWRDAIALGAPQPAVRGVADGMAGARVDWLRLLGNGVVPLAAGHALRALSARLAASGSAGAARLVRMTRPAA